MNQYELLVIGGGPAGYAAAIRGSQLGKKTGVVERDKLGGTCLNKGCIPTKSLLESSGLVRQLASLNSHGINVGETNFDYKKMVERKNDVVSQLVNGLQFLMRHKNIDVINGEAALAENGQVLVNGADNHTLSGERIVIATGTQPLSLPGLEPDGKCVVNSDQLLEIDTLPSSLLIIGGGVIGCEFATIFNSLGVDVTIVELMDRLLPTEDEDISRAVMREFKKGKVSVLTQGKVKQIERGDKATVEFMWKGKEQKITVDLVLVSVGRKPIVPNGFSGELTRNGYIQANEKLETSVPGYFAAGDVIGGLQLAHLAMEEGMAAVNSAFGITTRREWHTPRCVYTNPEVAAVGLSEKETLEKYGGVKVGKFSLKANGKALILGDNSGFAKVVAQPNGMVTGVHMVGPHVTELIAEGVMALERGITLTEWAEVIHPHPTVSESVKEAVMAGLGLGLHS